MKELLKQYAAYNIWANNKMIAAMETLGNDILDKEMLSSFKSIRATVQHSWGAEDIWMQRLLLSDNPTWSGNKTDIDFEEACSAWKRVSKDLYNYVAGLDETTLASDLHYADMKGNKHATPVFLVLQHVFNHATYHRGQLVTLMRTAGVTTIPGTDFIAFVREKH